MTEFEKVLITRDEMSEDKAKEERQRAMAELNSMLEDDSTYEDIEEMLMCDYGLEMDYIMDLI